MNRRTIEEGLDIKKRLESPESQDFIHGEPTQNQPSTPAKVGKKTATNDVLPQMVGRKSLTIKLHPQVASDLKRLSLIRQLEGVDPHTMQDMAEEAINAWLKKQR